MPIRNSKLLKSINGGPPVVVKEAGITRVSARYRNQFSQHILAGYKILNDNEVRFRVERNGEIVECWIESDPIIHRK